MCMYVCGGVCVCRLSTALHTAWGKKSPPFHTSTISLDRVRLQELLSSPPHTSAISLDHIYLRELLFAPAQLYPSYTLGHSLLYADKNGGFGF